MATAIKKSRLSHEFHVGAAIAKENPTVDFVFKLLVGTVENTVLLIHPLNFVLEPEYPIEQMEILNPFNDKEFEGDKLSIVDVKACDSSGAWYVIEVLAHGNVRESNPFCLRGHLES